MKKLLLLIIFFSFSYLSAQVSEYDSLIIQKSNDKSLHSSLIKFKKGGIEKNIEIDTALLNAFVENAKTYIGTKHCMGGLSHKCIDCSGLLYVSFKSIDVNISRTSEGIARYGKIIVNIDSLKKGDLIFFVRTYKTSKLITHTGIYLGDYNFIHTSASRGVIISDIRGSYYKKHYIFGTRVF